MKYMGSKRKMLQNGLGFLLRQEMRTARRFVDLFSGSGVVARFVAERFRKPVVAVDFPDQPRDPGLGFVACHSVALL